MSNHKIPDDIHNILAQYKSVARALDVLVYLFDSPVYQGPDLENRDIAELLALVQEKMERLGKEADRFMS